ncbi:MAG TPA: RsmD family RNA methyltransferase [Candidatus Saccharimonadales bacterium]
MRVIAGELGGRHFDSPHSHRTHPMSDRVRGGLFNTLGDIVGLKVLDAFAGTGALSFEAVSRGAASSLAIENDRPAQKQIEANIAVLGVGDRVRLIKSSSNAWLTTSPNETFDIILCDPPYDDLQLNLLARLAVRVTQNGLLVLSWPANAEAPSFEGLENVAERNYGDAQLLFYRKD